MSSRWGRSFPRGLRRLNVRDAAGSSSQLNSSGTPPSREFRGWTSATPAADASSGCNRMEGAEVVVSGSGYLFSGCVRNRIQPRPTAVPPFCGVRLECSERGWIFDSDGSNPSCFPLIVVWFEFFKAPVAEVRDRSWNFRSRRHTGNWTANSLEIELGRERNFRFG